MHLRLFSPSVYLPKVYNGIILKGRKEGREGEKQEEPSAKLPLIQVLH